MNSDDLTVVLTLADGADADKAEADGAEVKGKVRVIRREQ